MKSKTKSNLRFLQRRYSACGFDSDYLTKLSPAEEVFLEGFARAYYAGQSPDQAERRAAYHRTYMATRADAMALVVSSDIAIRIDDLDAEKVMLLGEARKKS